MRPPWPPGRCSRTGAPQSGPAAPRRPMSAGNAGWTRCAPSSNLSIQKEPQGYKALGVPHPPLDAPEMGRRACQIHNAEVFDTSLFDLRSVGLERMQLAFQHRLEIDKDRGGEVRS